MRGFEVFRSVSPHASCDLVALKDGRILRIEVRTAYPNQNGTIHIGKKVTDRADHYAAVLPNKVLQLLSRAPDLACDASDGGGSGSITFGVWRNWWDYWNIMRDSLSKKTRFRVFFRVLSLAYLLIFFGAHYLGLRWWWDGQTRTTIYPSWKQSAEWAIVVALGTAVWTTATWKKD
jgi:hypothetical protein